MVRWSTVAIFSRFNITVPIVQLVSDFTLIHCTYSHTFIVSKFEKNKLCVIHDQYSSLEIDAKRWK